MEIDEYIPRVYLRRIIKHRKKRFLYVLESEATIDIQDAEIVPRSSCNGKKLKGQMRWMGTRLQITGRFRKRTGLVGVRYMPAGRIFTPGRISSRRAI